MRAIKLSITLFIILFSLDSLNAINNMELMRKAQSLRNEGKYIETAELYENFIQDNGHDAILYYSAACARALTGNIDAALENLHLSIKHGLLEVEWLKSDEDFVSIRSDERFDDLITELEQKIKILVSELPQKHNEDEIIKLPEPYIDSDISLEKTLAERRSIRKFDTEPISLDDISQILWAAYGITYPIPDGPEFLRGGLKTAPSAGALYPLELYVVAGNVSNLPAGVYKYLPEPHALTRVLEGDKRQPLCNAALQQPWVLEAPASIVYSAIFSRTTDKYGVRGRERYVCMDLGHSAENIYLQATALGLGTVAIGAFSDVQLKLTIHMTKEEEPLYIMPLGKVRH